MLETPSAALNWKKPEKPGLEERFQTASPSNRYTYVDVHFLTAGVDVVVPHTLRPAAPDAVAYEVAQISAPAVIYQDTTANRRAWTQNEIVLRSNVSNVVARLLLTVQADASIEGILDKGVAGTTAFPGALSVPGGQVAFPATQSASADPNTLDDYEEGSWTPSLLFGGAATGMTYSLQVGRYQKVGRKVWVSARFVLTAKGSSTGAATITGLPFTAENTSPQISFSGTTAASAMTGLTSPITALVVGNTAVIDLYDWGATGVVAVDEGNFNNTSGFNVTLVYQAAS